MTERFNHALLIMCGQCHFNVILGLSLSPTINPVLTRAFSPFRKINLKYTNALFSVTKCTNIGSVYGHWSYAPNAWPHKRNITLCAAGRQYETSILH